MPGPLVVITLLVLGVEPGWREWHAGVDLRTDLGARPVRPEMGLRVRKLDLTLAADPLYFWDGRSESEARLGWWFGARAWSLSCGWRHTTVPFGASRRSFEAVVLGVEAGLSRFAGGRARLLMGFELAIDVLRHGGAAPARRPSTATDLAEFVVPRFGARLEFGGPL